MNIGRKWLVKTLPDLSQIVPVPFERHFLYSGDGIDIRIQQNGGRYEFERKVEISPISDESIKFEITKEEYTVLKAYSVKALVRDIYYLNEDGTLNVKIYKDRFAGLVRAKMEFKSEEEAMAFKPLDWFGREITDTDLGRDKKLINLTDEQFKKLLDEYKS